MADLITRTRGLIGDKIVTGQTPQFTDDEIQDALDPYRVKANYWLLRPQETLSAGGVRTYVDYYADAAYAAAAVGVTVQTWWQMQDGRLMTYFPQLVAYRDIEAEEVGNWEDGATLYDSAYATVTPDTSELLIGHWTITAGHTPPLYLVGNTYDLYRTAADLLRQWATALAREFDFQTDRMEFKRNQQYRNLMQTASTYDSYRRVNTITMQRQDVNPVG